jgi:hypothetical protein
LIAVLLLASELQSKPLVGAMAVTAWLASASLLRLSSPWRSEHGPAVLVAAFAWAVAAMAVIVGSAFGLVLVAAPVVLLHAVVLVAGAVHLARGRRAKALAYGHVTAFGCLFGIATAATVSGVLFAFGVR